MTMIGSTDLRGRNTNSPHCYAPLSQSSSYRTSLKANHLTGVLLVNLSLSPSDLGDTRAENSGWKQAADLHTTMETLKMKKPETVQNLGRACTLSSVSYQSAIHTVSLLPSPLSPHGAKLAIVRAGDPYRIGHGPLCWGWLCSSAQRVSVCT